jgi:hypothetical protein
MRLFGLVRKLIAIPNNEITVFTMEYSVQLGFPKNR